MNRLRGGQQVPEYKRVTRAKDPTLRSYVPILAEPTENANQTLNKVVMTLNRAGTSKFNPILSGLGQHIEFALNERDRLISYFIYQSRPDFGPNRVSSVVSLGGSIFGLDMIHGIDTVAGSPSAGAIQNFYRVVSAAGEFEKTAWVKSYDKDVVTINDLDALDDNLDPVEIELTMIAASQPWIQCNIGFMKSWADEFYVPHARNATDQSIGNFKAYGGAKFVSLFQTGEDEGVGTEVNPETTVDIKDQHTVEVENTAGLKHLTVRFRSKSDSAYYVDVPVLLRVVAPDSDTCDPPISERCGEALLLADTPLPEFMPGEASEPNVQVVEGTPGDPLARKLMFFAINFNMVGASPVMVVRRAQAVASAEDVAGFAYEEIGDDEEYLPLIEPAVTPVESSPYTGPAQAMIALDYAIEKTLGVALYTMWIKDGDHISKPVSFPGPKARDIQYLPFGETGGTDDCFYA